MWKTPKKFIYCVSDKFPLCMKRLKRSQNFKLPSRSALDWSDVEKGDNVQSADVNWI